MAARSSKFDAGKQLASEAAVRHVGNVCFAAAEGRRAARALTHWCQRLELGEPEFQVLWCLRDNFVGGFDQTSLVRRLAFSPAQVSAIVERLRSRGWILQQPASSDRRRNLWHLSQLGSSVVAALLKSAHELRPDLPINLERAEPPAPKREAA